MNILELSSMTTGSAPADSISLDFTKFSDDETWLLAVDTDKTQQTTEEWLAGALDNVHVSKTATLSRVLEGRRKKNRKGTHDLSSLTNTLNSVTEENGRSNNNHRLSMENDTDSETDEFFDAPTTFENAHGPTNVIEFQPECSVPQFDPTPNNVSPHLVPKLKANGNANTKSVSYTSKTAIHKPNVRRSLAPTSAPRSASQTRQTSPNFTVNPLRRSPNGNGGSSNFNHSLSPPSTYSHNSSSSPNSSLSFLDISRKAEEQEKKLKEELMHAESRPASSASTNLNGDLSKAVAANISTSKSVDFNTAIQQLNSRPTSSSSSGTPSRIPTLRHNFTRGLRLSTHPSRPLASLVTASKIKTTSSSASSLDKPTEPTSARSTASQPPNTLDDPWGENCF